MVTSHHDEAAVGSSSSPTAVPASSDAPTPPASDEPYTIFDKRQKALIVFIASVAATFSGFAGNSYFPALPTLAKDFDVSIELINLTVTSYLIFQGIAPSLWGPISDVKGRRVAYCFTFTVLLGACVGLAEAKNYATLIVLRCLQSTGSASTIAIGSGVVGDISTRADRGGLMGIFQAGLLVPVAVAPVIGGALAGSLGWRSIFWFLAIYSGVFLIILVLFLPETLRSSVGNGSRTPSGLLSQYPLQFYQRKTKIKYDPETATSSPSSTPPTTKRIDLTGPLRILFSKQSAPIIVFIAVYYTVWQMGVTAMSPLFKEKYGLSETQIGLTFIGNGVGSIIGTLVTGRILDRDYKRVQEQYMVSKMMSESSDPESSGSISGDNATTATATAGTTNPPEKPPSRPPSPHHLTTTTASSPPSSIPNNTPFPLEQARLRLLPLTSLLQILSTTLFGWSLSYPSRIPLAIPILATFMTGWTAVSGLIIATTYLVDMYPTQSAAAGASLNLARCFLAAGGISAVGPMVGKLGTGWGFMVCVGGMVVGLGGLLVQMRWGGRWRGERERV